MDKNTALTIQRELELALSAIAAKHGLRAGQVRGKFSPEGITFSGEFKELTVNESGEKMPADFPRVARALGLPEDCYGKTFSVAGKKLKISGIKPRNTSYPVIATGTDGKTYKLSVEQVLAVL